MAFSLSAQAQPPRPNLPFPIPNYVGHARSVRDALSEWTPPPYLVNQAGNSLSVPSSTHSAGPSSGATTNLTSKARDFFDHTRPTMVHFDYEVGILDTIRSGLESRAVPQALLDTSDTMTLKKYNHCRAESILASQDEELFYEVDMFALFRLGPLRGANIFLRDQTLWRDLHRGNAIYAKALSQRVTVQSDYDGYTPTSNTTSPVRKEVRTIVEGKRPKTMGDDRLAAIERRLQGGGIILRRDRRTAQGFSLVGPPGVGDDRLILILLQIYLQIHANKIHSALLHNTSSSTIFRPTRALHDSSAIDANYTDILVSPVIPPNGIDGFTTMTALVALGACSPEELGWTGDGEEDNEDGGIIFG